MKKTPSEFLEDKVFHGEWINDNHNNYTFLEFWQTFYKGDSFEKAKRKFHYHAKKLVQSGMAEKCCSYLSARDISNFGRRTMITYRPKIFKK